MARHPIIIYSRAKLVTKAKNADRHRGARSADGSPGPKLQCVPSSSHLNYCVMSFKYCSDRVNRGSYLCELFDWLRMLPVSVGVEAARKDLHCMKISSMPAIFSLPLSMKGVFFTLQFRCQKFISSIESADPLQRFLFTHTVMKKIIDFNFRS
jgi:hypothetical protein